MDARGGHVVSVTGHVQARVQVGDWREGKKRGNALVRELVVKEC